MLLHTTCLALASLGGSPQDPGGARAPTAVLVELVDVPSPLRLPATAGANPLLTVRVTASTGAVVDGAEVWIARTPRAAARCDLVATGPGRFQANLAAPEALVALDPDSGTAAQRSFHVFARTSNDAVGRSVAIFFDWTAAPDVAVGQGRWRVHYREGDVAAVDRVAAGSDPHWVTPADVQHLWLEPIPGVPADAPPPVALVDDFPLPGVLDRGGYRWDIAPDLAARWQDGGTLELEWGGGEWLLRARPDDIRIRDGGSPMRIAQRRSCHIPGARRFLRCAIGDITGGGVRARIADAEGRAVLESRLMREGDVARFAFGKDEFALELRSLHNAMIGTDEASFVLHRAADVVAPPPAADESDQIAALIDRIAKSESGFVRNGRRYPGPLAAAHLERKWRARPEVVTVQAFLEQLASQSSTTDQPYVVVHPDGTEQPLREWLQPRAGGGR